MLWQRLQKIIICLALAPAATCGGAAVYAAPAEKPLVEMNYTSFGELASRYCEVYNCEVDLPPAVMSYPIIVPFYSTESRTYLEAQLRAVAFEKNYSCKLGKDRISCVEKKKSVPVIDSSNVLWKVNRVDLDELELVRKIVVHNQGVETNRDYFGNDSIKIDSLKLLPLKPSNYLYTVKVLIKITNFDLSYRKVGASYINDYYAADFNDGYLKYGSTVKDLTTTQTAENGTQTSSYKDKLQGLQIDGRQITVTANDRDLDVYLFGGTQVLTQVRKDCRASVRLFFNWGFDLGCGLVQTEIFVSLE
jgi:hypothetical protein